MKELKTAKTFDEQLAILESRDMVIDDADAALRALKSMNYYRLTGYAYQFKHGKNERYKAGTSFETVLALYRFDNDMKPSIKLGGKTYRAYPEIKSDTIFAYIICMERFIPHDKMELIHHVSDVIHRWIGAIDLGLLGFPDNWEKLFTDEKLLNPISKLPAVKRPSVPPSPCN